MTHLSSFAGIVLAAGRSRRMGRSKALLPCLPGKETFVARSVRTLREGGIADVLVVGRGEDRALQAEVASLEPGAVYVVNPSPDDGQLSSLVAGLEAATARHARAVVVLPVDLPQVRPATVAAVCTSFAANHAAIARATCRGQHGHPVVFGRAVFQELRDADPSRGARAVLHADPGRVLNVEVDDPGVLRDVDWPADYAALFGEGR